MESFGFFMAILMSFVTSLKEISIKSNLKDINSNTLIFLLSGLSIIFWLPFLLYQGIPELSLKFWLVFFISGILFYIGKLFNFKAMQAEDISFIAPLKGLVSIGAIIVGIFILNEYPSLIGWIGITVILLGAYFLNLQKYHTKFLDPFIHIVTNKGSRYYLVSVLAYSFTVILDKIGVLESSIIFWIFMMQLFLFCVSSKNFKKSFIESKIIIQKKYKFILLSFILYAVGIFSQMTAIQYIFAGYVSLIKTASMIFTIMLGWFFFKEKNIIKKLSISIIIMIGMVLIYFA